MQGGLTGQCWFQCCARAQDIGRADLLGQLPERFRNGGYRVCRSQKSALADMAPQAVFIFQHLKGATKFGAVHSQINAKHPLGR